MYLNSCISQNSIRLSLCVIKVLTIVWKQVESGRTYKLTVCLKVYWYDIDISFVLKDSAKPKETQGGKETEQEVSDRTEVNFILFRISFEKNYF